MIKIFNTLKGEKREFKPIEKGKVKIYTCGPTLYDYAHIGNFSSYLSADMLKRYLRFSGLEVLDVMNLTDVDDKTIKNSRRADKDLRSFTDFYEKAFFQDSDSLNITRPKIVCRATDNIPEMVDMIKELMDKGFAYQGSDGSVYFKISKFPKYGKLSKIEKKDLRSGASGRISDDEYSKDDASDFVLWKAWNEDDGNIWWDSPFGKGRPGWHIECSAMSRKYLGDSFDIHTGGADLVFPHHENEIAQSEAASGQKFVNFWIHRGFLKVDGRKMSKSLGNFYRLSDIAEKVKDPLAFRYLVVTNHYRLPLNFTVESLKASESSIGKIRDFVRRLEAVSGQEEQKETEITQKAVDKNLKDFKSAFDDDLGSPQAIASLFEFMSETNKRLDAELIGEKSGNIIISHLKRLDQVWAFIFSKNKDDIDPEEKELIESLIQERKKAKQEKNWQKADDIRRRIQEEGFTIEDRKDGTFYKKI